MFKWLARLVLKPLIGTIKKAIGLCDKLSKSIDQLIVTVNGLPLEQAFKDEIIKNVTEAKTAVTTVKSVLIKVLEYIGESTTIIVDDDSIAKTIEVIKKAL